MAQPSYPIPYVVDPEDPRAPSEEQWAAMTPAERDRVVALLPADIPLEIFQPEGDPHRKAKERTLDALGKFFTSSGRRVYLSSELAVYYPGKRRIVPDVIAVVDVDPHDRDRWVVSKEGKGIDFALEVHVSGDRRKDHEANVARYAELGIPEYFIFDRGRLTLRGYRLPSPKARVYEAILPQAGLLASSVLGVELSLEGDRLRFYHGSTLLMEAEDVISRLHRVVDDLVEKRTSAMRELEEERARAEEERARAEEERARAEEERARADRAEAELAALRAEIERLRGR